jgi:hypothetical protein
MWLDFFDWEITVLSILEACNEFRVKKYTETYSRLLIFRIPTTFLFSSFTFLISL